MSPASAKDLVFTLFGDFFLDRDEAIPVGVVIRLLEPLKVSATSVRTAMSRLTTRGWFERDRAGGRGLYRLSARGRRMLDEGASRIHDPPIGQEWDGEWTLVSYSVPEEHRARRDRLRTRLTWLGFGALNNGLWISPHDQRQAVAAVGVELELSDHLDIFRARHVDEATPSTLVSRCWDLDRLNRRYDTFVARHLRECARLKEDGTGRLQPSEAFVRRLHLVHEYRDFPRLDPYLPRPLQPTDWAGECALALFRVYHDLLEEPATRFVGRILGQPPAHVRGAL